MLLKKKRSRELLLIYLFLLPAFAVFMIYRIIPLGWNLLLSFQEWKPVGPNDWIGLSNYAKMFKDEVFWKSLTNTVIYFAIGSPIAIILAIFIAIFVNQPLGGRNAYRALIFLPYPITPIAIGIIWQWADIVVHQNRNMNLAQCAIPSPHQSGTYENEEQDYRR